MKNLFILWIILLPQLLLAQKDFVSPKIEKHTHFFRYLEDDYFKNELIQRFLVMPVITESPEGLSNQLHEYAVTLRTYPILKDESLEKINEQIELF